MKQDNKIKIIYLLGSGHCGSTLFDLIMDSHSKIAGVGELGYFPFDREKQDKFLCACRKPVSKCSFWKGVFQNIPEGIPWLEIHRKKVDFLFNRAKYFFTIDKKKDVDLEKYLEFNQETYQRIADLSGKRVIFDSSKIDIDRADLLLKSDKLEMFFVHLVRDGRGVTYSYKMKYGRVLSPIFRWALRNIKIEIFRRRYPGKFIFVKYEDFCKNPEQEVKRIVESIGLNFEPQMLDFRDKDHHQVGGNRLKFDTSSEIKEDLVWKDKLPLFDRLVFYTLFGWLNKYYGY